MPRGFSATTPKIAQQRTLEVADSNLNCITDSGGLSGVAEGASLSHLPELTFSGLIQKEIELKGGLVRLQTNFNYEDEWNNSLDDSPLVNHESTFFVNARAAYIFGSDEQYEVAVFVDNITEEQACRDLGDNGSLTNSLTCSPNPGMAFYGISGQIGF